MTSTWTRKPIAAGLGLASTLFLFVAGCGGGGSDADNAVLVPDPSAKIETVTPGSTTPAAGTAATTPAETGTAAATPSSPAESVKAEGWGTLKGQITFDGNPPPRKDLVEKGKAPKNPEVCAVDAPIKSERLVVDGASKGVKNVLVYIPKPTAVSPEAKSTAAKAEVVFDQEKCVFEPHVVAVMNGAKLLLKNSDPVNHNINSKLKNNAANPNIAPNNEMPFPTQAAERTPGEVVCDIHPWMKAYWMVTDSPYFAVTDAQGNYEIKNVPAGTQKVAIWQEAVAPNGFVTAAAGQNVNIKASDTTTFNAKIEAGKIRPE